MAEVETKQINADIKKSNGGELMSSVDKITDTTMRGLQIGVLAGVSGGIMGFANKAFGRTRPKRRKTHRKRSNKKRK